MKVSEAVATRRSVRGFLPKPVSKDVIAAVLTKAAHAPSGGNLQPWNVAVLSGAPLQALKDDMRERPLNSETPEYAVYPAGLSGPYEARRVAIGEAMYGLIGVAREDRAGRRQWFARNFQLFGAIRDRWVRTPAI